MFHVCVMSLHAFVSGKSGEMHEGGGGLAQGLGGWPIGLSPLKLLL